MKIFAAIIAACLLLFLAATAQEEILPVNAPIAQDKAIKIMTAEERSEILIYDIWKPVDIDRVKIGKGTKLGIAKEAPKEPYGWQAFVRQDAISDLGGSNVASAYGRM